MYGHLNAVLEISVAKHECGDMKGVFEGTTD
jgi:hypothetical protein